MDVAKDELASIVRDIVSECGLYWTFENAIIFTDRPMEMHFNHRLQLHKDGSAALLYRDGYGVYALNGIRMPERYVVAKPEDINPLEAMKEQNVEIRRELFRKIGLERLFEHLNAKVIHRNGDYELVDLDLGDNVTGRYLKMKNPSIHCVHVEGVPDECETVFDALKFRNRSILTAINGGDKWIPPTTLT